MTYQQTLRPHLVERAMELLGDASALGPRKPHVAPPPAAQPPQSAGLPIIDRDALTRAGLVSGETGMVRNRLSQEFNVIQQAMLLTAKAAKPATDRCAKAILVTSARPGEGKSFIALNIAASIAAGGATDVLLVDVDGKRGSLSELLGVSAVPGLRLLTSSNSRQPTSLMLPTAQPRLSFLSYGAPVEGELAVPPGPMVSAVLMQLAAALPDHVIVLDSPPCLCTSEPSSFAPVVGQVLMVVEAEKTQRNEVEAALDMVDACSALQLILNRTQMSSSDTFGAYGSRYHD